ncbi:Serine--tRNA ligase, mitochondrial [Monascus purpureus]|uniref:serine--tRNA ligase n=1 Tax=Monascus purpureus TaxID=5098 RepID=A0A507R2D2_MONPU|nr:Serine--tRNA ligase, mitochondrial [Monascus purpureus]BDD57122.1 hypothetical protein MAP00_002515 [Monascus purpureus]
MATAQTSYVCLNCRISSGLRLPRSLRRGFTTSLRRSDNLRPATAPKQTPDIRHIRDNAELYAKNCIERNYASHAEFPKRIQDLAEEARRLDHDLKAPRTRMKQLQKSITKLVSEKGENGATAALTEDSNVDEKGLASLRQEAQRLKDESYQMTTRREECAEEIHRLALSLPNLSSPETPIGNDPRLVGYVNFDPNSPPAWTSNIDAARRRSHVAIGASLGLIDFASSATTTGWGWYFLTNEGALLEQALIQYALSVARRRGWKVVSPPSVVYSYIAEACGFQPRDQNNEQQVWSIEQSEKDKAKPQRSLTGTAEIPLAAMYAGRDIDASELPVKLVASSRCYRAEAGARGVDTKGLYRVHEFTKVELFGWADNLPLTQEEQQQGQTTSDTLFSELLEIQTEILTSLNLPCRILEMPTTDLGASAARKRDIEALFPSRLHAGNNPTTTDLEMAWGEVTSASICTDYQTRRLGTRARGGAVKGSRFPHTVNGTAIAVPRVLAAILENGWDENRGLVVVPEVLRTWMGMDVIGDGRRS